MSSNGKPSVKDLIDYAGTAAEDAAAYRGRNRVHKNRPEALVERLVSSLEFEAIDTYFGVLVSVATGEVPGKGGIKLETAEDGTQTLTLFNGAVVEMNLDCEDEEPFSKAYVLHETVRRDADSSIGSKLIEQLEQEVGRHF